MASVNHGSSGREVEYVGGPLDGRKGPHIAEGQEYVLVSNEEGAALGRYRRRQFPEWVAMVWEPL